jgi:hypothetical protein
MKHVIVCTAWEAAQSQTILTHLDMDYRMRTLLNDRYFIIIEATDSEDTTLALLNLPGEIL